jgi:hypothetical protein
MMPYMGARMSATEKLPPIPMIGKVGIIRIAAYIAENTTIRAICLVVALGFRFRFVFLALPCKSFLCSVTFYIAFNYKRFF